jgi:hypothetical protein
VPPLPALGAISLPSVLRSLCSALYSSPKLSAVEPTLASASPRNPRPMATDGPPDADTPHGVRARNGAPMSVVVPHGGYNGPLTSRTRGGNAGWTRGNRER